MKINTSPAIVITTERVSDSRSVASTHRTRTRTRSRRLGALVLVAALGTTGSLAMTTSSAAADICFLGTCIKEPVIPPLPPVTLPPKLGLPPIYLPPGTIPPVFQPPTVPPTTAPPATTPPATTPPTTTPPTTKPATPKRKGSQGSTASTSVLAPAAPDVVVESAALNQGGSAGAASAAPVAPIVAQSSGRSMSTLVLIMGLLASVVLLVGGVGGLLWHRRQA